ncbi:WAS/WASL-interacting protein family member 1 [Equus caballus]|uniref:WAS/WASL-interacting protein family member 1 n=1 Tax=Equus caballus TaxID=9796 RepID=UPI0038B3FDCA
MPSAPPPAARPAGFPGAGLGAGWGGAGVRGRGGGGVRGRSRGRGRDGGGVQGRSRGRGGAAVGSGSGRRSAGRDGGSRRLLPGHGGSASASVITSPRTPPPGPGRVRLGRETGGVGGAERSLVVLVRSCTPTGADTYAALSPRTETGVPSRRGRGSPSGPTASPAGAAARARTPPTPGGRGGAGGARAQGRAGLRSRCHGPHTHPWALPASPQPRGPAQSPPRRLQPVGRRRRRGCDWVFRTRVERRAHSCPFSPLPPPPAHFPNLVVLKLSEKIRGI